MDNKDNANQNTEQVQNTVNNTVTDNTNNVVNAGNVEQSPQVQPVVDSNNITVQNTSVNNTTPTQSPLEPTVAPTQAAPASNNNTQGNTNIPKSQAEAVSNNNEVDTSGNLISAKDAGVGTSTNMKTKEELTKKDKLLDGLPGIGVPVKEENTNNSESVPSQPEEITKEKVSVKKKVQYFFTVIFFILVAVFIYFLPEITDFMSKEQSKQEVITDGFLTCELETNKKDITTNIKNRFGFSKEKLDTYKREKKVSSSSAKDSSLDDADKECEALYEQTKALSGVDVNCSLKNKVQTTTQSIDYGTININKVTSAFAEAGGTYPDYELGDDINEIESEMKSSGFECKRSKT